MLQFIGRSSSPHQSKPKRRVHKEAIDPIAVVNDASRVGDARFQYFVETGKLRRSK